MTSRNVNLRTSNTPNSQTPLNTQPYKIPQMHRHMDQNSIQTYAKLQTYWSWLWIVIGRFHYVFSFNLQKKTKHKMYMIIPSDSNLDRRCLITNTSYIAHTLLIIIKIINVKNAHIKRSSRNSRLRRCDDLRHEHIPVHFKVILLCGAWLYIYMILQIGYALHEFR